MESNQQRHKRVFVSGCYDMLHSGHVAFFKAAAQYGDLYVGIGSDATIEQLKNRKTVYSERERLYMVKAIRYVTDAFINFNPGRHNILYSAPFLLAGGLCYLYRDKLHRLAKRAGNWLLAACIAVNALYFVCPQSAFTLHSVVPLLAVFTLWLVYALGAEHKWMHNRVIDFLSGISMEIYLCHMVMFRVVEKMHLERIINDENALFATVCILGIGLAAAFSYFMKLAIAKVLQGKSRIS